jgi:hypothetical protein
MSAAPLIFVPAFQIVPAEEPDELVAARAAALARTAGGCIALDGEGYTDKKTGEHHYTFMAAATATEVVDVLDLEAGETHLSTKRIFNFLLNLPEGLKVGFALGYDTTKWFQDLKEEIIYKLLRPETRAHPKTGRPEGQIARNGKGQPLFDWGEGGPCEINLVSTKLTIRRGQQASTTPSVAGDRSRTRYGWTEGVTVWDFFRFFGRAFVPTLEDWTIGTPEERAKIQAMKDKRGDFEIISEKEKEYCKSEVINMAKLADKLLGACKVAGIQLTSYYGPGSLAAAMLDKDEAKTNRPAIPAAMEEAVQRAFFGGRFEVSRCGPILPCEGYDLASAYPFAETAIPCFKCGDKEGKNWRLVQGTHDEVLAAVRRAHDEGSVSLVHYSLPRHDGMQLVELDDEDDFQGMGELPPIKEPIVCTNVGWGPFPFRLPNGSIVFPVMSAGGWVWSPEFLPAVAHTHLWPNIRCHEAWIYDKPCKCLPPFLESVAGGYINRLKWGKEGPGMVIKLGLNSRYGKRAQSVGQPPYRCLVTAGLITSTTRGQIDDAIGRAAAADTEWSVVSVATDGILVDKPLVLPEPRDTGTLEAAKNATKLLPDGRRVPDPKSPLGAWEAKSYPKGIHSLRPGMRFRLDVEPDPDPKEEGKKIKDTAARGLGVKILHQYRKEVLEAWEKKPRQPLVLQQKAVFWGAKLCISRVELRDPKQKFFQGGLYKYPRHPNYGCWREPDPYNVSYAPLPKRPRFGPNNRLLTWALSAEEGESNAYDKKKKDALPANQELQQQQDLAEAQPEGAGPAVAGEGDD